MKITVGTMPRELTLDESADPLPISDDAGFWRGIEVASGEEFMALINSMIEMRDNHITYSGQHIDRRMRAKQHMSMITRVGKLPIKKA